MTRKIVRWLGKILSPVPNTVTSDLSCCCGCLCCGLRNLTFELGAPANVGGTKIWSSDTITDYECEYNDIIFGPGSAYALFITLSGGVWNFVISLYCENTYEQTPVLAIEQNNVVEVNNYPSGEVSFVGIGDPALDEQYPSQYVCKIKIKFTGNKAFVTFTRTRIT